MNTDLNKRESYYTSNSTNCDYFSKWYPLISNLSFPSWIIEFSLDEALCFKEILYSVHHRTHNELALETKEKFQVFINRIKKVFEEIKQKEKIQNPDNVPTSFFVRLDNRSPKDAVIFGRAFERFSKFLENQYMTKFDFNEEISSFEAVMERIEWENQALSMDDLKIISNCQMKTLEVDNIDDAFDLLINSERILKDIEFEIGNEDPTYEKSFKIIIRKFDKRIKNYLEFRGFVYNFELTALTQYDEREYRKEIEVNKEGILQAIMTLYHEKVKKQIENSENSIFKKEKKFIIDFGIIFDNDGDSIENYDKIYTKIEAIVIEINRFNGKTSSSLFDWENDDDFRVMIGQGKFEFRTVCQSKFDDIDFEDQIYSGIVSLAKKIKKRIVQRSNPQNEYDEESDELY